MGKGIRKQVYDLTAEDLTKFPIWSLHSTKKETRAKMKQLCAP